jgi:hypothetical protein
MKSFEENTEHQIIAIRAKLIENYNLQRDCIKKYGYDDHFEKFNPTIKILNHQLKNIEDELIERYNSLELNSNNLIELESTSNLFVYFESIDISIISDTERKIIELTTTKEDALKQYDFRTANSIREEIRLLQKYYIENK